MKKYIILIIAAILLIGCVHTEVDKTTFDELHHITVEKAKAAKPDSIVIITQNYKDYVFVKKGEDVILTKQYLSHSNWIDMPAPALILLIVGCLYLGFMLGYALNK